MHNTPHTKETKKKISLKNLGHKHTVETKLKIGESSKGRPSFWSGKKLSPEHRKSVIKNLNPQATKGMKFPNRKKPSFDTIERKLKIGDANRGEKSHFWQGGKSFEEYGNDWTETLKNSIRQRDNYMCRECGLQQDELDGFNKKLDVHHIDYDKKNCNPNNLITLCHSCHSKTTYNRNYWINYFNKS